MKVAKLHWLSWRWRPESSWRKQACMWGKPVGCLLLLFGLKQMLVYHCQGQSLMCHLILLVSLICLCFLGKVNTKLLQYLMVFNQETSLLHLNIYHLFIHSFIADYDIIQAVEEEEGDDAAPHGGIAETLESQIHTLGGRYNCILLLKIVKENICKHYVFINIFDFQIKIPLHSTCKRKVHLWQQ